VPVDASLFRDAVRYAARIAAKAGAELVGFHVVDAKILNGPLLRDVTFMSDAFQGYEYAEEVRRALEEKGRRILARFEELAAEFGRPHRAFLATGVVPGDRRGGMSCDLVVMGKRGENRDFETPFLGSVAESAIRLSSRAVIIVPESDRPIGRILVAYDGSKNANRAIAMLTDLAGLGTFEIIVATVADADDPVAAKMEEGRTSSGSAGSRRRGCCARATRSTRSRRRSRRRAPTSS
jgi:nucleotide-binding universal stress UspA family protein